MAVLSTLWWATYTRKMRKCRMNGSIFRVTLKVAHGVIRSLYGCALNTCVSRGFPCKRDFLPACKANWIIKLMAMVLWLLIMKYPARLAGVSRNTLAVRWIYQRGDPWRIGVCKCVKLAGLFRYVAPCMLVLHLAKERNTSTFYSSITYLLIAYKLYLRICAALSSRKRRVEFSLFIGSMPRQEWLHIRR